MKKYFSAICLILTVCAFAVEFDFTDSGARLDKKYVLTLRGDAALTPEGLKLSSDPNEDKAGGAITAKPVAELSPESAFECEVQFRFLPEIQNVVKKGRCFLWDSKYNFDNGDDTAGKRHHGFMMYLEKNGGNFQIRVLLGLEGKQDIAIQSNYNFMDYNSTHTVRFKFDPSGWQELYCDGLLATKVKTPAGRMAPALRPTSIGCRNGSLFGMQGMLIKKARIEPVEPIKLSKTDFARRKYGSRRVFVRREKNSVVTVEFTNTTTSQLKGRIEYSCGPIAVEKPVEFAVDAEAITNVSLPVESNLLPGKYPISMTFKSQDGDVLGTASIEYIIVPEFTDSMPLLAGDHFSEPDVMDTIHDMGISIVHNILSARRGKMTEFTAGRAIESLDLHLEHGLRCDDKTRINDRFVRDNKYILVDRNGKPYPRKSMDAAEPEVYNAALEAVQDAVNAFGNHPAWARIYTNNEMRDSAAVSFTNTTRKHLKEALDMDNIPPNVEGRLPIVFSSNPKMPWNNVVSTNDSEFRFWQWFWKEGDGWDRLNGDEGALAVRGNNRPDFYSDFGPATRALPYLGVAGDISLLSSWTYCDPDPVKLGVTIDELLTLSDGKKLVGMGNQGIWYRNRTAPKEIKVDNPPEWLAKEPDAKYISPAPDLLLEGFWVGVMRKIEQFDTHGQGSWLRPMDHAYRFTNPEIRKVYPTFMNSVGIPLGPALKHVDEVQPEVMILESFTNALYGGGHPWGWGNGWIPDLHLALQWVNIQAGFCYEEHIMRGDLDDGKVKVLFLPSLQVLNDKLLEKLRALQKSGVILVADEKLNLELMPDIRFHSIIRDKLDAEGSKKRLQALGLQLRDALVPVLKPRMQASSQDLILRRRASGEAQYLFAANDRRIYGDYVGQWKRVMEKGLPLSASFTVDLPAGYAYDIVRHAPKPFARKGGRLEFGVELEPGSGSIIVLLPRQIAKVNVDIPSVLKRGENFAVKASVADSDGRNFKAVLPLEITIASGNAKLPGTGFYATKADGSFALNDTVALNMPKGKATLTVRCLTSGITTSKEVEIQ